VRKGNDLESRILQTLHLADRRGYGLSLDQLARLLVGGEIDRERLEEVVSEVEEITGEGDLLCLRGRENLLPKTREKLRRNRGEGKRFAEIGRRFLREFVSLCPFLRCAALAGSLASNGFSEEDDIDLNLFVENGRKYTTYLLGNLLALKYSLRYRKKPQAEEGRVPLLPKLVCINVVWEEKDAFPFVRRDLYLAYELLLSRPVFGSAFYREMIEANPWLTAHFPQLASSPFRDEVSREASRIRILLESLYSKRVLSSAGERASREVAYRLWQGVQLTRRRNPAALARVRRVREMQRPYTLFGEADR
jgi:hypothetical protein